MNFCTCKVFPWQFYVGLCSVGLFMLFVTDALSGKQPDISIKDQTGQEYKCFKK